MVFFSPGAPKMSQRRIPSETDKDAAKELALRKSAWIIGITYAILAGWSLHLSGAQAAIIWCIVLSALYSLTHSDKSKLLNLFLVVGLLNATSLAVNSNHRLHYLNILVLSFITTSMLIAYLREGDFPMTVDDYLSSLGRSLCGLCLNFFLFNPVLMFITLLKSIRFISLPRDTRIALILSLPILLIFHSLLSQVNDQYLIFVEMLWTSFCDFIRFLWDIEIVSIAVEAFCVGYLWYLALSQKIIKVHQSVHQQFSRFQAIACFLVPLLVLLFLFSFFQTQLFFLNPTSLSYLQLSTYVRQGFFQLLAASIFGMIIWQVLIRKISPEDRLRAALKAMLLLFAVELLMLTLFSQHKLIVQQLIFGFRDERVFASSGVVLLTLSFAIYGLQVFHIVSEKQKFICQYLALFALITSMSVINLELLMNRTNPIRFEHNNTIYKDYSYLLTNSYDNNEEWLTLIKEAQQTGIPIPDNYYWGAYSSLCGASKHQRNAKTSLLREHRDYLLRKYDHHLRREAINAETIRNMLRFNLREYQAYQLIKANSDFFDNFIKQTEDDCFGRN